MDIHSYIDQPTSQRQQTINLRSYERNIPSQTLQPYLDSRPVLTKYSVLPIVDLRKSIETPLIQQATFTPEKIYNPGNDSGPWSGYASNINHESELRNQLQVIAIYIKYNFIILTKHNNLFLNYSKINNFVLLILILIQIKLDLLYLITLQDNKLKI